MGGLRKRKKYVADFETTTDLNDCRVWAYGFMEIGNKKNYRIGNNMDDFMGWLTLNNIDVYFHNLKFDGSFIVNYLLHNGWICNNSGQYGTFDVTISNMNQWYKIDITTGYKYGRRQYTTIYDSLKKLPFTVERIGKAFDLGSLKVDVDEEFYRRYRPIGHEITDEEKSYIYSDLEVMADALEIQFNNGLLKMTIGSDSLTDFKAILGGNKQYRRLFPEVTLEMNENLRKAYKGGFTWLNKRFQEKDIEKGMVFDVNSLYPFVMYSRKMPFGTPIPFEGEYIQDNEYPLYIIHIRCSFIIKDGYIPTIQIKNKEQRLLFKYNEYIETTKGEIVDLYLTNVDYELFKEHYYIDDLEILEGWKFKAKDGLFKKFIEKWSYIKATSTGAKRELAKLMLNSLYGKFCKNPNITGKKPFLKPDGSNVFRLEDEEQFSSPEYTPVGTFITAYAREYTIRTAQSVYDRIIYCDTDSIHITGTNIPESIEHLIDKNKLGYWDYETTFVRARYLRQKSYCQDILMDDGTTYFKVTCAGMPDKVKENVTFDNFKIGFKSYGKLMPKQVKGGVVLVDSEFTIKEGV